MPKRRGSDREQEMDSSSGNVEIEVVEGKRRHSPSRTEVPFPWDQLPRELQVKILQKLARRDLDKCRLLNRDIFDLIRCNDQWMRRRLIDYLELAPGPDLSWSLIVTCDEEGFSETMMDLTTNFLLSISSCVADAGCEVDTLSLTHASFAGCGMKDLLPINDDILAQLTANEFMINASNLITVDGLRAFVKRLSSGKQHVYRGVIFTNFPISEASFPEASNVNVKLFSNCEYVIELSTKDTKTDGD